MGSVEGPSYGSLAGDASRRIHSILAAAESEAAALRMEAERGAERTRREAEEEATRIVDEARAYADEMVRERLTRIAELSDAVVERTEMLLDRMSGAAEVKRQLESVMRALGDAAEAVAHQSGVVPPRQAHPNRAAASPEPQGPASRPAPEQPSEPEPQAPLQEAPAPAQEPDGEEHPADARPARLVAQGKPSVERSSGGTRVESQYDSARLVALQMAVGGSSREEVAAELKRTFDLPDISPILDDVFGSPGSRRASPAGR